MIINLKKYGIGITSLLLLAASLVLFPNTRAAQASGNLTSYYVVTAVDANGVESNYSNEASCALTTSKHTCNLNWNPSTSVVAGYYLYKGSIKGGPYTKVFTTPLNALTYNDVYLLPNPPAGLVAVPQ